MHFQYPDRFLCWWQTQHCIWSKKIISGCKGSKCAALAYHYNFSIYLVCFYSRQTSTALFLFLKFLCSTSRLYIHGRSKLQFKFPSKHLWTLASVEQSELHQLPYSCVAGFATQCFEINKLLQAMNSKFISPSYRHIQYQWMFPLCISQLNIKLIPSPSLQDNACDLQSIALKRSLTPMLLLVFLLYSHTYTHPPHPPHPTPKKIYIPSQYYFSLITGKVSGIDVNN